jgi:hypothetical protein
MTSEHVRSLEDSERVVAALVERLNATAAPNLTFEPFPTIPEHDESAPPPK